MAGLKRRCKEGGAYALICRIFAEKAQAITTPSTASGCLYPLLSCTSGICITRLRDASCRPLSCTSKDLANNLGSGPARMFLEWIRRSGYRHRMHPPPAFHRWRHATYLRVADRRELRKCESLRNCYSHSSRTAKPRRPTPTPTRDEGRADGRRGRKYAKVSDDRPQSSERATELLAFK